jgi:hemin uptake protein HemP
MTPRAAPRLPTAHPAPRRIDSRTLLGSERVVEIVHGGQYYTLRLTSLGKLILTK